MEGRFLLDVVVRKSSAVLKLLSSEDESLLIGGDALLVLDFGLDILDGVRRLNVQGNGLASQSLDEDLHTTAESKHEMESGLLLNIVVRKCSAVLELLSSEDESLLIGGNALLVLDLSLDVFNGVRGLNIEGDGLSGKGLDEDLHATTESENQVKG